MFDGIFGKADRVVGIIERIGIVVRGDRDSGLYAPFMVEGSDTIYKLTFGGEENEEVVGLTAPGDEVSFQPERRGNIVKSKNFENTTLRVRIKRLHFTEDSLR